MTTPLMYGPKIALYLTPKTLIGWGMRLTLLLTLFFGVGAFAYPLVPWSSVSIVHSYALHILMIGAPIGGGLLWVLGSLGHEQRRLKMVSEVDHVTALPNRVKFIESTRRVLPQSGVLLVLDVDDFRSLNDRRGRRVGDLCLMALAQRFRELTRKSDVLGRMDGASFAVYLPGATVEHAYGVADRLCQGVLVVASGQPVYFTTSVGAVFANGRTPLDRLLHEADLALDRAKLQGRATVVLDELPLVA